MGVLGGCLLYHVASFHPAATNAMAAQRLKKYRKLPKHSNCVLACLMRELGVANEAALVGFFCNADGATKAACIIIDHARRVTHIDSNSKRSVANLVAAAFIVGFQNLDDDGLVALVRKFLKPTCANGVQVTSGRFPDGHEWCCINPSHYEFDATTAMLVGFVFPRDFNWAGLRLLPISGIEVLIPPKPLSRATSSSTAEDSVADIMPTSAQPSSPADLAEGETTNALNLPFDAIALNAPDRDMSAAIAPATISTKKQAPRKKANPSPRKKAKGARAQPAPAPSSCGILHLGEEYLQMPTSGPIRREPSVHLPSDPFDFNDEALAQAALPPHDDFGGMNEADIDELLLQFSPSMFPSDDEFFPDVWPLIPAPDDTSLPEEDRVCKGS